jgi:hypothetical protein
MSGSDGTVPEDVAFVVVDRPRFGWAVLRTFKIDVDGKRVGHVSAGQRRVFTVSPGSHVVRARLDWSRSRSVELDLAAGEIAVLACRTIAWESLLAGLTLGLTRFPDLRQTQQSRFDGSELSLPTLH